MFLDLSAGFEDRAEIQLLPRGRTIETDDNESEDEETEGKMHAHTDTVGSDNVNLVLTYFIFIISLYNRDTRQCNQLYINGIQKKMSQTSSFHDPNQCPNIISTMCNMRKKILSKLRLKLL